MSYSSTPIFAVPARLHHVLQSHRVQYIVRGQSLRLQQLRIDIQHNRTLLTAVDIRNHGAWHRYELCPDKVSPKIIQRLLAQTFARKTKLKNRHARRAEVDDLRRQNARRKLAQLKTRRPRTLESSQYPGSHPAADKA